MAKSKTKYLAIDIDPEGLIAVAGSDRVEHAFAWLPGSEHGPPAFTPETAKQLGQLLRARLDAAGFPVAPLVVGIGREKAILKDVKFPGAAPDEETRLVHHQAMKELGDFRAVFDYVPLPDPADANGERRAIVVALKTDFFESVKAFVQGGGWKTLAGVTLRPYAIAAGLGEALASGQAPPLPSAEAAAAVVSLSPQGGEFTVIRGGAVVFTRAVPPQSLETDTALLNEIRRNLTTYDSQNASRPIVALYVPEAQHMLGGWFGKLDGALPIPVHSYDPVVSAASPPAEKQRGRFAGAVGLLAARGAGLPVNLAAPRQAKKKTDPKKPLMIAAAIAAGLLIVVGGVFGYMAVSAADETVAQKQEEKTKLEKLIAEADPDAKRIAAADAWQKRSVNYLDELFDLADRMPANDTVRVNKITGTAQRVDKTGKQNGQAVLVLSVGAKNPLAASELVSAIDRDNTKDRRFYVGTSKTIGGADTHANAHNQLATITTTLNHRSPAEYTRYPSFTPPRRGVIPAAAPEPEKKPTEEPKEAIDEQP